MNNIVKQDDYSKQSIITDPRQYAKEYDVLPDDPKELLRIVQGLVIHGDQGELYGVSFSKRQANEELLRTVPQMLERLFHADKSPLAVLRPPKQRLVGMCRDYSLLLISFMRHKGFSARLRVGYANYFQSDLMFEDHWLVEYYDSVKDCWIRMDAQLDDVQKKQFGITFNTEDMMGNEGYLLAGLAWTKSRLGDRHQDDFGYNKNWKGWHSIKGNLLHDFNCMLGLELLPWDLWTELSTKKYNDLNKHEKALLDEAADITVNSNVTVDELNALAARLPDQYMVAIQSKLKVLEVTQCTQTIDPNKLEPKFTIIDTGKKLKSIFSNISCGDSNQLVLKGVRQNNLKNVNISIPKGKLTVITGVSGSGKSSLAFDTIYAEGKRRYLDNMSNAAKLQDQIEKPDFDSIHGLTPTIAIEQKKGSQNPRSTVGTLTGILDYLRMLYVAMGTPHCPYCGKPVVKDSKSKNKCRSCNVLYQSLTSSTFNSNAHAGACHTCNGLGNLYKVNPDAIVINEKLSILDGATHWWGKLRGKRPTGNWMVGELYAIAADWKINLDQPWNQLPEDFKKALLYGTGEKIYEYYYISNGRDTVIQRPASGIIAHIQRLFREAKSDDNPYKQYMKKIPCPTCLQELLCPEARYTTIMGYRLPELLKISVGQLWSWLAGLEKEMPQEKKQISAEILPEIEMRTANLIQVGLSYLTLNRTAPTLSGGELQRVRLSSQLGSDLVGLTYILDEPSIGLHPRDHHLMIDTMKNLRNKGNTVIVVEHDKDTMLAADYIIDVGPGAGVNGGEIVAAGSVQDIMKHPASATGRYLKRNDSDILTCPVPSDKWLSLKGCTGNNLKNIDAYFPLHSMCCITGISGSGKSTLVFDTLIPALDEAILNKRCVNKTYKSIEGIQDISGFAQMDQTPVGKSVRSVPATYIGVFDAIRALFARQAEARRLGYGESYFSFNSKDGQCSTCDGLGQVKIELQYMADHWATCPDCKGSQYKESILSVTCNGKTIADVLKMDVSEAIGFFAGVPEIQHKLSLLDEVGLSYIKLGQSTATLSGGEAQRLKLAKELGNKQKKHMLYILDEPSTGLHFQDIEKLIMIFRKLVSANHSILIIEHNTDIIRVADWVIDLGPDGGERGGLIVATGTPKDIMNNPCSVTGSYL